MVAKEPLRCALALLCLVAIVWFFRPRAQAQELPLSLTWTAPASCPGQAQLEADTRAMIARLPEDAATHPVEVEVIVERGPGDAFQAVIHTLRDGVAGERRLRDPSCRALARAVALILALTLNADLVEEPPPPAPPPPAPSPPPPLAPQAVAPPARSEVARPRRTRVTVGLGLDMALASGVLPALAPGVAVRMSLKRDRAALELRLSGYWPQTRAIPSRPGGEASFQAGDLALLGCYGSPHLRTFGLAACAGGELAWVRGESVGVADPDAASGTWPRMLIGIVARVRLPANLALRLGLEGARAFRQPTYAIAGAGNVYRPSAYGFRVALGLELHF